MNDGPVGVIEGATAWTTLDEKVLIARPPYVRVVEERVCTEAGRVIDDFYRVVMPPFAVCVPVTSDGRVLTLWQYKHGPRAYGLTFPAGFIEDGEDPAEACRRELLEETGYAAAALIPLGVFVDAGNQEGATGHYFAATGCEPRQAADSGDLETMTLRAMRPAEIEQALRDGHMRICHHVTAWLLATRALPEAMAAHRPATIAAE